MKYLIILSIFFGSCGSRKSNDKAFVIEDVKIIESIKSDIITIKVNKIKGVSFEKMYFKNKMSSITTNDKLLTANFEKSKLHMQLCGDITKEYGNKPPKPEIMPQGMRYNDLIISYKDKLGNIKFHKINYKK